MRNRRLKQPSFSDNQIAEALRRDLVQRKILSYLLGRSVLEALEEKKHLIRVVRGHRTAWYSTRQYLQVRARMDSGNLIINR